MSDLNENHKRRLLITFKHIDTLLAEALHTLDSAGSPSSFQNYVADATPVQRKVMEDYIARVRETMRRILERFAVEREPPRTSAIWSFRVALISAEVDVDELDPRSLRGYGELSAEAAQALDEMIAEMRSLLRRMAGYLAQGPGSDLQARLARLERTTRAVVLLQELERSITARGLVEFRTSLALLVDRMESSRFEIAVFGRVSSGKSSLLNYILKSDILPTGVTPVTAIPTRIVYGDPSSVRISFADNSPITVELARLPEFATEQQNPGNTKHVAGITIEAPSPLLKEGVTLVDTPGLGSLATSGAAESLAYLPRCDLGIVLIDAATTLTHEDLWVVQALYASGATAMVLVSKADLLTPADRARVVDYVEAHLRSEAGVQTPVHAVSVIGPEAALCDHWLQDQLLPLFKEQQRLAAASLRRKIGALREAVVAALRTRLEKEARRPAAERRADWEPAEQALRRATKLADAAWRPCEEIIDTLASQAEPIMEAAAVAIAEPWAKDRTWPRQPAEILSAALSRSAAEVAARLARCLTETRTELLHALQKAATAVPSANQEEPDLPRLSGMPVLDTSPMARPLVLRKPSLSFLGKDVVRRSVLTQMQAQVEPVLREVLRVYGKRLAEWSRGALDELKQAFEAKAESFGSQIRQLSATPAEPLADDPAAIERDLETLSGWGVEETF